MTTKAKKKLKRPVVLFASVEQKQHEALRELSYRFHLSIAELTRDALTKYISEKRKETKHHAKVPA